MKKLRLCLIAYVLFDVLIGGYCGGFLPLSLLVPQARAQSGVSTFSNNIGGRIIASEYGKYVLTTQSSMTAGAASTVNFQPCFIHVGTGNRQVFPFWALGNTALNVPLQIQDGSNSETVYTESAASFPSENTVPPTVAQYTCSFTITPANSHSAGVLVTSGDGGLMEAANDALSQGINEVDLDSNFTGTPSNSSYVPITGLVSLVDLRGGNRPPFWTVQSSTLTGISAPTTRVGSTSNCTGTNTVCDTTTAVASGGFTNAAQYVWVAYVDYLGGVSPASATAHYTSAGAVQIEFVAPAASTGAVGWIFGIGLSYATAYWFPASSTYCTLTTIETVTPACAVANAYYGQTASNAFVSKPLTTFALYPSSAPVAAAYNPVIQSHTTFSYLPARAVSPGFQTNFGPFTISPALTAGQATVLGTVALPAGYLNNIGSTLRVTGKLTLTTSTSGTIQLIGGIGDITDFSTGTPKAVCTLTQTTALGTAANEAQFQCDWTTNATGTTGSIMPDGYSMVQLQAGTTAGALAVESATAAITTDVQDQDLFYVEFLQSSAAESTTPPQLQSLHLEVLSN